MIWAIPGLYLFTSCLSKQTIQLLQRINVNNIRLVYLVYSQPLPPLTTIPELIPKLSMSIVTGNPEYIIYIEYITERCSSAYLAYTQITIPTSNKMYATKGRNCS